MQQLEQASWLWNDSDRWLYHRFLCFRRTFTLPPDWSSPPEAPATLLITADGNYQASINDQVVGHGPAKSAAGRRSVDHYSRLPMLKAGLNTLDILVLSIGTGTMTYCAGPAGVIFALTLPDGLIVSDSQTMVRSEPRRHHATVRRWFLPCIERIDCTAKPTAEWQPATVVDSDATLYPRRVPLPSRRPHQPATVISADVVALPNVMMSVRIRPYLIDDSQRRRCNVYQRAACIVSDLLSPREQSLEIMSALGNLTWYLNGESVLTCSGWSREPTTSTTTRLRAGANRLIGVFEFSHFEDISFVGWSDHDIQWHNPFGDGPIQVCPAPADGDLPENGSEPDWSQWRPMMPSMDPADIIIEGNDHDRVIRARRRTHVTARPSDDCLFNANTPMILEAANDGRHTRYILDMGKLVHGWLAVQLTGHTGSTLRFSFFDTIRETVPRDLQWEYRCNNTLTYHLQNGLQSFESFHSYGARYIALVHSGDAPIHLHKLELIDATCLGQPTGRFLCSDPWLNRIYADCVQSLQAGVDDTFTDGPMTEQANWNVDNRLASMGERMVYRDAAIMRNSILLFAEDPDNAGLVRGCYPAAWDLRIPLWGFHWVMWCADYFRATGDTELIRSVFPRIEETIAEGLARINEHGLLQWSNVWHFVEWHDTRDDNHPINGAEQAGFRGALTAAAQLAHALGGDVGHYAIDWCAAGEQLATAVNTHLWDPDVRAYADALLPDGSRSSFYTATTNAMCCLYQLPPPSRRRMVIEHLRSGGGSNLLESNSLYNLYYVLAVFDQDGDARRILEYIRRWWHNHAIRPAYDETDANIAHGRGPNHPAAAFVLHYLVKYGAGIEMNEPGFAEFSARPAVLDLAFCQSTVPTIKGPIRIAWKKDGHDIDIAVEHPNSIRRRRNRRMKQ